MKLTKEQQELLAVLTEHGGHFVLTEEQAAVAESVPRLVSITRWGDIIGTLTPAGKMPTWAIEHFPTSAEEAKEWSPLTTHSALAMRVLCVAQTRIEGTWAAYCNAVPGISHRHEAQSVLDHGDKLPEGVARELFPGFGGIPYAR